MNRPQEGTALQRRVPLANDRPPRAENRCTKVYVFWGGRGKNRPPQMAISLRSGTRPAKMPVGLQYIVQIRRDRDLIVGKVAEPGSVALHGVGQQGQDFAERHADAIGVNRCRERRRRLVDLFGACVNPQFPQSHGAHSLAVESIAGAAGRIGPAVIMTGTAPTKLISARDGRKVWPNCPDLWDYAGGAGKLGK